MILDTYQYNLLIKECVTEQDTIYTRSLKLDVFHGMYKNIAASLDYVQALLIVDKL